MRIRIVLDGKGFADALSVGPLVQTEHLEVSSYEIIAELQMAFNIDVTFFFVFGHCGVPRNELTDQLCTAFLQGRIRGETRTPLDAVPLRLCDSVNIRLREMWPFVNKTLDPFGRRNAYDEPAFLERTLPSATLGLSRHDEIRLYRLRTLCAPSIGTVIHDCAPQPCKLCGERVMKRARAVFHLFECQSSTAVDARQRLDIDLRAVPDNDKARQVLEYAALFENGTSTDEEPTAGPDSDVDPNSSDDEADESQLLAATLPIRQ
jgi:hypothetical protein